MGDRPSDQAQHGVDAPFPRPSPALAALLVSRNQGHLVRGHRPVVIAAGSEQKRPQLVFQAHVGAASGPEAASGVLPGRCCLEPGSSVVAAQQVTLTPCSQQGRRH